jgi:hypothetical protein
MSEPTRSPNNADPNNADPNNADPSNADPSNADPSNADPSNADPSNADPSNADPSNADESTPLHDPAGERSGADVDEAVATAEAGSAVDPVHQAPGTLEPGESRVEHMVDEVPARGADSSSSPSGDANS